MKGALFSWHRFLDLEFNCDVLGQRRLHLLARGRAGGIAVLMALDVRFNIEIVFGFGSSRSNVLGILLCLKYLQKAYG